MINRGLRPLLLPLVMLALSACQSDSVEPTPHIINDTLRVAYQDYDNTWSSTRAPVSFPSGETATSCATYAALKAKEAPLETTQNQLAKSEYVICDSLATLKRAGMSASAVEPSKAYGNVLVERLDLRSVPSSLGPALSDERYTLRALDSQDFPVTQNTYRAGIESDERRTMFEVVATADIDRNGQADWLLWLSDEIKTGTYRGYLALVIYNPAESGTLEALAL